VQGALRLSLPMRGGIPEALALIASHEGWIAAQVSRWPQPLPFTPGAIIPFDGEPIVLEWHPAHPRQPRLHADALRIGGPEASLPARTLRWLRAEALADMAASTHEIAAEVARPVTQVRVGDPRARWGSCSTTRGVIAYSWRLILAPTHIRRNVVAHEVAHLVHGHHGPAFYALLAGLDPNTGASKLWLHSHGAALHWVGREA